MKKLMKFTSKHCAPCKLVKPTIEKLVAKLGDKVAFEEIDLEAKGGAHKASKHDVLSIPCVLLLDETGKELVRIVGNASLRVFEREINPFVK